MAAGGKVDTVWSRNTVTGQQLATLSQASWLEKPDVKRRPGWLMLAVKDEAVTEISQLLTAQNDLLVLHASGTLALDVLHKHPRHGVMWPLQSMQTAGNDWSAIPLFLEADAEEDRRNLKNIATALSGKLYEVSGTDRLYYHLAAVIAGNFSNALYQQVYQLLQPKGLDPGVLLPILTQGLKGLMQQAPAEKQTGPAIRNDLQVMEQHLQLLNNQPELAELYRLMSRLIQQQAGLVEKK